MKYCPNCTSELVLKKLATEDRERLVCSATECQFIYYDNPTPVVAAVIEYQDKILLAHNVLWPVQWYALITGFLEKGESPVEGVVREVKEETNLDATVQSLIGLYTFHRMNQLIVAYHVKATGQIKLNEELDAYRLYDLKDIKCWDSGTGHAMRDFIKSKVPHYDPPMITLARPDNEGGTKA